MRYYEGAALAVMLAWAGSAAAQSPPPPMAPPPMMMGNVFSGFYVGANAGMAFGDANYTLSPRVSGLTAAQKAGDTFSSNLNGGGFLGGLQAGYNWALGPSFLVGAEADFDYDGLSSNSTNQLTNLPMGIGLTGSNQHTVNYSHEYLGTVRGRLGWLPTPTWLLYATGGFAYGQTSSHTVTQFSSAGDTYVGSGSGVKDGWTVGGGTEFAIAPQWTIKAEYLYVDLGGLNYADGCTTPTAVCTLSPAPSYSTHVTNNEHIVRVGLNYHFGAPPPPPPMPAAMPAPPPAAAKVFIVFFDWDKDVITPEGHQIIQQAADAYKSGAPVQLQVTGYTDRSGSPGYNQRLSERRANNVAKALSALGVPKDEMMVSGKGENDNRVPTADGVREPQNRRVEIVSP